MSSCPNISSPEWKALVNKIGENNSWREFLANGYIPSADNYDIVEPVFETENKEQVKPEQIRILGSKEDIEKFAKFVNNSNIGNVEAMQNYMNSKSLDFIMNKLIDSGKIKKEC